MTRPTSERGFGEPLNGGDAPKPTIFIQANDRQLLGARIAAYSYKRNSSFPDSFDVRVMNVRDFPKLMRGRPVLSSQKAWCCLRLRTICKASLPFASPRLNSRAIGEGRSLQTLIACASEQHVALQRLAKIAGSHPPALCVRHKIVLYAGSGTRCWITLSASGPLSSARWSNCAS